MPFFLPIKTPFVFYLSVHMATENSNKRSTDDEESGWTLYFEDFLTTERSSSDRSFSVADAASSVANYNKLPSSAPSNSLSAYKDINSKRRKMKDQLLVEDDSLEDTATSPVNSPKVSDSTFFSKNRKKKENLAIPQENGYVSGQINDSREMGFPLISSDCTELKKRGLCLVPLSMVANYLAE